MPESEVILEADGLRVVFFRRGDRYAHRVDVFDAAANEWQPMLESLEGEPGEEWPPSPPFQQLHVEHRASGPIVFLIGMAGKTHWSAAVEVAADHKSITFDVATRVQLAPWRLGSEYTAAPSISARLAPLAPERGEGQGVRGKTLRIETTHSLTRDGHRIEPPLGAHAAAATIAWRYAVAVTPAT